MPCHKRIMASCNAGDCANSRLPASSRLCHSREWIKADWMRSVCSAKWRRRVCCGLSKAAAKKLSAQSSAFSATQPSTLSTNVPFSEDLIRSHVLGASLSIFIAHSRRFSSSSSRVSGSFSQRRACFNRDTNKMSSKPCNLSNASISASVLPILCPLYCCSNIWPAKRAT